MESNKKHKKAMEIKGNPNKSRNRHEITAHADWNSYGPFPKGGETNEERHNKKDRNT